MNTYTQVSPTRNLLEFVLSKNCLLTLVCLSLFCLSSKAQMVRSATAPDRFGILPVVDQFRLDLGAINPNVPGSLITGRREINWDGVPDAQSAPALLPPNFFNSNSPRGVVLSSPSNQFQVSANAVNPFGAPIEFGNINPSYPSLFSPFTFQKLFTSTGTNIYDVSFFIPGTATPALTRGFGAVFSDVDVPNRTLIEFFGLGGTPLGVFAVPPIPGNETFSFLGVSFPTAVVSRVRITTGTAALNPGFTEALPSIDLVTADDFIFGEPVLPADLAITKTSSAASVVQGSPVTYTITVSNTGVATAQNLTMTDVLPAGTTFVSLSAPAGWAVTTPAVGANGTVTASIPSLTGGTSAIFTLTVQTSNSLSGSLTNTATISSSTDPNTANNSASSTVTVQATQADLSVTKTASSANVLAGQPVTFTFTVTNTSPAAAQNVMLTDVLPAGLRFQSFSAPAGFSSTTPAVGAGGTITSTASSLAGGASATFTLVATANGQAGTIITNTATVSSTSTDPNAANNSSSVSIMVSCPTITVSIPDAMALPSGVLPNTVYPGYDPASSITLTAMVSGGTAPYTYNWSNGSHTSSITVSPTTTTTYTVSVTDAFGCSSNTASKTINVIDVQDDEKPQKVIICHKPGKLNITLSIGADDVADHLRHGDALGACTGSRPVTHRGMPQTKESATIDQFTVAAYPNPFGKSVRIQYTVPEKANVSIKVYDVMGREVTNEYYGNRAIGIYNIELNGAKFNAGVYYCQVIATIKGQEFKQVRRLVKSE